MRYIGRKEEGEEGREGRVKVVIMEGRKEEEKQQVA